MKTIRSILTLGLCFFLTAALSPASAQTDNTSIVVISKFKMTMPEGGSIKERDSLLKVWHEKIDTKNTKLLGSRTFVHLYSDDSRDMIFEAEYKTWADIDAGSKMQGDLVEKAWPDEIKRMEFFKKWNSYFGMHTDNIYTHLNHLKK